MINTINLYIIFSSLPNKKATALHDGQKIKSK